MSTEPDDIGVDDLVRLRSGRIGVVKAIDEDGIAKVAVSGNFGTMHLRIETLTKVQLPVPGSGDVTPFCRCGEPVITQGMTCHWCTRRARSEGGFYL